MATLPANQTKLDALTYDLLDLCISGKATRSQIHGVLVHLFNAIDKGNQGEVDKWLNDPSTLQTWKKLNSI